MSSTSAQSQAGQAGPSKPPTNPLYWQRLPSIKILRPPTGKFSPQVDERCFTYCSQSIRGRLEQAEPWCRSICIRRVFDHEVRKILSSQPSDTSLTSDTESKEPGVNADIPLPPEGQRIPSVFSSFISTSESGGEEATWHSVANNIKPPPEVKHWKAGWYLWLSKSRWAAQEKMDLMMCDLERQAEWQKYKQRVNEEWADSLQGHGIGDVAAEDHGPVDPAVQHQLEQEQYQAQQQQLQEEQDQDSLPPLSLAAPFPDVASDSLLLPLPPPLPPLDKYLNRLLTPAGKVLSITSESVTSGNQKKLAEKIWEKAGTNEPFILARNVCKMMWKAWKEGEKDEEGKDRPS